MTTLPHDLDAERAVLGVMLQTGNVEAVRSLPPGDMYAPAHVRILEAALTLANVGQPIDHLTVADKLKAMGCLKEVGGPAYLMQLDQNVPVAANVRAYVATVQDRAQRRAVIAAARKAVADASDLGIEAHKAALDASGALASVGSAGARELETMEHALGELLDELQAVQSGQKQMAFPTGIDVWDNLLGGLPAGYVTVIAAQPSVGKSALKGTILRNLAQNGVRVGTFELEDPRKALAKRYVASDAGVPVRRLGRERLPENLMQRVGVAVQDAYSWAGSLVIDNRSRPSAEQVAATARQMVVQRGCKVIVIDHATEIDFGSAHGRNDLEVASGVRLIRDVAKDLDVSVVMLAHFRRPKDSDKEARHLRPTSTMTRDAAVFEQASRLFLGLWLDPQEKGGVTASVLKQSEGEKDFDFWMPMEAHSGLIASYGGRKVDGMKGYSEPEERR